MLDEIVFSSGLEALNQHLDWKTIHGLYSNAIYGGRVDDVHDIRILMSYLQSFFNPDVIAGYYIFLRMVFSSLYRVENVFQRYFNP